MGHYSESYERDEERARKASEEDRKRLAERIKKDIDKDGLEMVLARIVRGEVNKW
jgi:hypothetical protein